MKKIITLVLFATVVLAGCSAASIEATKWDTGVGLNAMTRCEHLDMRDSAGMDAAFKKYDGWKLIYVSEYTTDHKVGTDAAVCFERPQ